jgi:hypothetical protein
MAPRALIPAFLLALLAWVPIVSATPAETSILQPLDVTGVVEGDVVVVAADVRLAPTADVRGHVVAVFGRVEREPGARVSGATVGVSSLAGLELYGDPATEGAGYETGVRLVVTGIWLTASTLLAVLLPGRLRRSTWMVGVLGLRIVVLGALVLMTATAALVAAIGLGRGLGVPLAALVMVVFLAAKVVGVTVLGGALGAWLSSRLLRRTLPLPWAVLIGVTVLLALRLLPVAGAAVWTVVSVLALGAGVFAVAFASDEKTVGVSITPGLPRR